MQKKNDGLYKYCYTNTKMSEGFSKHLGEPAAVILGDFVPFLFFILLEIGYNNFFKKVTKLTELFYH